MRRVPSRSAQQNLELLAEIDEFDDLRDAYARVREGILSYEQAGSPVPEELLRCEQRVVKELMAQSQGR